MPTPYGAGHAKERTTSIKPLFHRPVPTGLLLLLIFALLSLTAALALHCDGDGRADLASGVASIDGSTGLFEPLTPQPEWTSLQIPADHLSMWASVMSARLGYQDALTPSSLSQAPPLSSLQSSTPVLFGQSEYMIGDVAVAVIFPESNGAIDAQSETWNGTRIDACLAGISDGLSWWEIQEPLANLTFHISSYGTRTTSYEPITRPHDDEGLWIAEIMDGLGYGTDNVTYLEEVAALNSYEMDQQETDWAFTIFVVDSLNDADGMFSDSWFAYSWIGGPFLVMTYDNNGYGIGNMDFVCAHETGHIFWATDEYDGFEEYSGYLNVADDDGASCLMNYEIWNVCPATAGQIGWRDSDSDNVLDPMDTAPDTIFDPAPPDFTSNIVLMYTGQAEDIPLPNNNPQWWSSGQDVSINTISEVQYRVDGGDWFSATPDDGAFDEGAEAFAFTTSALSSGPHTIEARALNSAGNWDESLAQHSVVVDVTDPTLVISAIPDFVRTVPLFGGSADDPAPGELARVEIQIRNVSQDTYWDGASWVADSTWITASGTDSWSYPLPALNNGISYSVRAMAVDSAGNESPVVSESFSFDTTAPAIAMNEIPDIVDSLPAVIGTAADAAPGQVDRVEIQIRNVSLNTYWDEAGWVSAPTWIMASGTDSWSRALPSLTNGSTYEVRARAFDSAGNDSMVVSDTFTFDDLTVPTVWMISLPDFVSALSWISGTAADAPPGQMDRVEVQIRNATLNTHWDGAAWVADSTWITASGTDSWSYPLPSLDNGTVYGVSARAIDTAGNESAVASHTFIFDSAIPTITMDDIAGALSSLSSIGGTAVDAPPGQLDRVEIQIGNVEQATYWDGSYGWTTAPTWIRVSGTDSWSYALPSLDSATYQVSARAIDRAGNASAVASDTFALDNTAPVINMNAVSDPVNSLSSVGGTAADAGPGQLDRVEIQIRNFTKDTHWDGVSWISAPIWISASGTQSWSYPLPPLSDGSAYEIRAKAIDGVGNESPAASESFTYDAAIPTVAMNDIAAAVNSLSSIGGTAADAPPGQLYRVEIQIKRTGQDTYWGGASWTPAPTWVTASGTQSWTYSLPALIDGSAYEIRATANDTAGNQSAVAADTFIFDTTTPTITMDGIPEPADALSSVDGTAADAPPGQLNRVEVQIRNVTKDTWWDGSSWASASVWVTASGTDSWSYALPRLAGSTYEITARAIDTAGNESAVAADTFTYNPPLPSWIWIVVGIAAALLAAVAVLAPRLAAKARFRSR
jgi:predicted phage tail protein